MFFYVESHHNGLMCLAPLCESGDDSRVGADPLGILLAWKLYLDFRIGRLETYSRKRIKLGRFRICSIKVIKIQN
jgi:hypothetical protein